MAVLRVVVVTGEVTILLLGTRPATWLQVGAKTIVVTGAADGAPNCRATPKYLQ